MNLRDCHVVSARKPPVKNAAEYSWKLFPDSRLYSIAPRDRSLFA